MQLSDDEQESRMQEPPNMTKAELRKTHKPIMEKRRRARINNCLNEIKNLILEAMNKDPARHTKLEKADILEMAVKHLQNVQRQQLAIAMATDPSAIRKFKSGFNDCATEIERFITKSDGPEGGMKERVSSHLQKCISGLDQASQFAAPTVATIPFVSGNAIFAANSSGESTGGVGDQNNNPRIQVPQGIQVIPSRLPTGELALLLPNSSNLNYFPSHHNNRPSAFAIVSQHSEPTKILSPPLSPVAEHRVSPKGFRPIARPKPAYPGDDHQVPQVSSTVVSTEKTQMEVKTIKFPINRALERKIGEHPSVIRKLSEPLCVITNHGERYKQAQQKEDSLFLEENRTFEGRGVKRDYSAMLQTQGPVSGGEGLLRPTKIIKMSHHGELPSSSYVKEEPSYEHVGEVLENQQNKGDHGDNMWRPW